MNRFHNKRIFLDYASATPVLPEVKRAMEKYWSRDFYNPNAIYEEGVRIKKDVDEYRTKIAQILGVAKETIIFTSGGTEANTWAVRGVKPGRVVVEQDSHPSVSEAANKGIRGTETTLDSAKLYGPKGVGALIVKRGVKLDLPPLGTPTVPLIVGFAKALEIAVRDRETEKKRLTSLSASFINDIQHSLPEVYITQSSPNIINLSVPGIPPELLVLALDRAGVLVSAGPACNSNKPEPPDTPVRFSFGRFTTTADVKQAVEIFCRVAESMVK